MSANKENLMNNESETHNRTPRTPQNSDSDTGMPVPICAEVREIIEEWLSGLGEYPHDHAIRQNSDEPPSPDHPIQEDSELCNEHTVLLSSPPNGRETETTDSENCSQAPTELTQSQQLSKNNSLDQPETTTDSTNDEQNSATHLEGATNVARNCQGACLAARIVDVADQALQHGPTADIGQYLAGFGNHLLCAYPKCDVLEIARLKLGITHNGKVYTKGTEGDNRTTDRLPCLKTKQGAEKPRHYADVLQVFPTQSARAATAYGIVQRDHLPAHVPETDVSPTDFNTVESPQPSQEASIPSEPSKSTAHDQRRKQRPAYEHRAALSKPQKKCTNCGTVSAKYWRKHHGGNTACNACRTYWLRRNVERPAHLWMNRRGKR